jgi:hypothetical protein
LQFRPRTAPAAKSLNAVLGSTEHGVKARLRSPLVLPRVAVVNPELTYGQPPEVTAFTGLDALTQLIEAYVSTRANPLVDATCVDGIERIAMRDAIWPWQPVRRFGAGKLRIRCGAWICGTARRPMEGPAWTASALRGKAANVAGLRARASLHPAPERYSAVARLLTGRSEASVREGVDHKPISPMEPERYGPLLTNP